jgi:hypothetical protein
VSWAEDYDENVKIEKKKYRAVLMFYSFLEV